MYKTKEYWDDKELILSIPLDELQDMVIAHVVDNIDITEAILDYADANEMYTIVDDIDAAYDTYKDDKLLGEFND